MPHLEIERKFLVDPETFFHATKNALVLDIIQMQQGYFGDSGVRVRVAKAKAYLTIKGKGTLSRAEYEYEVPYQDGVELLTLCKARLEKTRIVTKVGNHHWEIDLFAGPLLGFILAEVELKSEDEEYTRPVWVTKEVTEVDGYSNASLARKGLPSV